MLYDRFKEDSEDFEMSGMKQHAEGMTCQMIIMTIFVIDKCPALSSISVLFNATQECFGWKSKQKAIYLKKSLETTDKGMIP